MPICQEYVQNFKHSTLLLNLIYINIFPAGLKSKLHNDLLASSTVRDLKKKNKQILASHLIFI